MCKWELRNIDRHVALSIPNLFFKLKKLQIKQIQDKVNLAIRKCKTKGKKITAGDLVAPGGMESLVKLDEGYKVLRTLRGSPPYWEKTKKDVFEMICQLGLPTWFCSFSAAETRWVPLLKTLAFLINGKTLLKEEVDELAWHEKCRLIRSDPVTCARYFDNRVQKFLSVVLKSTLQPIGQISNFFYRVEFQQRGSPHIHMLVWINNAPKFNIHTNDQVANFIDQHVSCNDSFASPDLINLQTHRHAQTCKKKHKPICRFNFPVPPMEKTCILQPLDNSDLVNEKLHKERYGHILDTLNNMKFGTNISFHDFLSELQMSQEQYILAIKSSLTTAKVFLKRTPSQIRINPYNDILLQAWSANMDLQYVLDPYTCAAYIVSYISKGERGMSNLLKEACDQAQNGDNTVKEQVQKVGNTFLSHIEIGAQEATYLILQMPLKRSSRNVVFINTSPLDDRTFLVKDYTSLQKLPATSTDIESDNMIKRYQRRPNALKLWCLAQFISEFEIKYSKTKTNSNEPDPQDPENYLCETNDIDNFDNDPNSQEEQLHESNSLENTEYHMRDGGVLYKRKYPKVIRYIRYNKENDSENYCREQIMLFSPWRKEPDLLSGCSTFKDRFNQIQLHIKKNSTPFNIHASTFDVIEEVQVELTDINCDLVAPETQHSNAQDSLEGTVESEQYELFNPNNANSNLTYDLGQDMGIGRSTIAIDIQNAQMSDIDYRTLVQSLNPQQKDFFYHTLHWFKTKDEPLYSFLSGGAGVGKTVLTKALYQALTRHFLSHAGVDQSVLTVLLCAPTGKAAYHIQGSTLHSAFHIPANQSFTLTCSN